MRASDFGNLLGGLFAISVFIAGVIGWVWNIMKLIDTDLVFTGLVIVRVIGIFVPPVGAIVGYL